MTFLEAVNRVLRTEGIIRGDDDDATSFSQTQHAATVSLAQIAIKSQLASLVAQEYIPYEDGTSTITLVDGTREYSLVTGFIRMKSNKLYFLESGEATGQAVYERTEEQVRDYDPRYRETEGTPIYWYMAGGTSKKIAFYPVPNEADTLRYYYEADVSVDDAADDLPFQTDTESETFVRMAARHFKYLFATPDVREGLFPNGIENDAVILQAQATLIHLGRGSRPTKTYGYGRT